MTYWRNDLLFCFWFIVSSNVTFPTGPYMPQVSKQCPVFGYFWLFLQDLYILRNLQRLMLTGVLRSNSFKNFGKFLETHPWWKFILAKLLSCALHRARWNEGTAMCIGWAVCKKTLLLVLDLKINRYKSTNGFLRKISKYFFLRQSTPAMQLVPSS